MSDSIRAALKQLVSSVLTAENFMTAEELGLAALALEFSGESPTAERLRQRLTRFQDARGAVLVENSSPTAFWPTPVAMLAWTGHNEFKLALRQAARFLLETTGVHWNAEVHAAASHDTLLRGWPWVDGTHSWTQPTAMALIALDVIHRGQEPRAQEAIRMLMDRQLTGGGWNYGNTRVFGTILRPLPEDTGYALTALRPYVPRANVQASLDYLKSKVSSLRSPGSLAWSVLALSAWQERPDGSETWIRESLSAQERLGNYPMRCISLLLLAQRLPQGLAAAIRTETD